MEKVSKMFGGFFGNAGEYARKTYKIAVFGIRNNFVLLGILAIGFCVIAPAIYLTSAIRHPNSMEGFWGVVGIYSIIAAYVGGLLIPAVMFSYVHKRRDRDFYHSMPVKRGQYFIGYVAAGFVMFAAPYLLMCFIMGVIGGAVDVAFDYLFHTLALYVIVYSSMVLAIMFSGSIISSVVTLAFLNTFMVTVTNCSLFLAGRIDGGAYMTMLSPYIYIFTPLSGAYSFYQVFMQGPYNWVIWVQLGIAVVELVLAFIMYNLRRGETTMAVAFPKTRYILQYGTMFLVALFCTSTISNSYYYDSGNVHINTESVIMTAIMVLVTFVIMNMILEKNFRAAFHKISRLFMFAGAYAVVLALIIGMVSNLPYFIIPIRTDAMIIRVGHYTLTFDKPDDDEEYYVEHVYENGRELYSISDGYEYYVVSDTEQVKELAGRISDCENQIWGRDYSFRNEPGEYYYVVAYLLTLKPGCVIKDSMYIDDIEAMSSQNYSVFLGDISAEEMASLEEGIDMVKTGYRNADYLW